MYFKVTTELQIPPDKCGLIIGKGGNTLKQMMQDYHVKLHLVQVFFTNYSYLIFPA